MVEERVRRHMDGRSGWQKRTSRALRVILLGDSGVGKTSLMRRFVTGGFDPYVNFTFTSDEMRKEVTLDNRTFPLTLIDTVGQERFGSLTRHFYRDSQLCVLTFALDNPHSFDNLSNWIAEFKMCQGLPKNGDFPLILVGNKADLIGQSPVVVEDARAYALCHANGGMPYVKASAKDGKNVERVFQHAVRRYLEFEDGVPDMTPAAGKGGRSNFQANRGTGRISVKDRNARDDTVVLQQDDIADMVVLDEKKKCCSG